MTSSSPATEPLAPEDGALDAVIVGGGLAGLSAAYALRDRRILLLEAADRVGGRIHSQQSGDYWLNFGAHMFGGPGSAVGDLVSELGLESRPIRGSLLGMAYGGRRALTGRLESFPFRMPLPLRDRLSFIKMGLALRRGAGRIQPVLQTRPGETGPAYRARVHGFEGDRTLSQMVGTLTPEIAVFLRAFTERTGGDPAEMAAGYALRSFANVWSHTAPGRNLLGGSAGLPRALADVLGPRVMTGAEVTRVEPAPDGVVVTYRTVGGIRRTAARTAIVATPAFVAAQLVAGLPAPTRAALEAVTYGPFLSVAVRTRETGAMPWDGNYAIATPDLGFSVLFNQATTLREGPRRPGGSLMLFRGANGAAEMMAHDDATIESRFVDDLLRAFPEARGNIAEVVVQRWPSGAPYGRPGRAALQDALTAPLGPIVLCGDYLEFPNMEAAARTGREAADAVRARLAMPPIGGSSGGI